jgi:hypothetical protein
VCRFDDRGDVAAVTETPPAACHRQDVGPLAADVSVATDAAVDDP